MRGIGRPEDEGEALRYFKKGCELRDQQSCEDYADLKKGKLK